MALRRTDPWILPRTEVSDRRKVAGKDRGGTYQVSAEGGVRLDILPSMRGGIPGGRTKVRER